VMAVGVAAGHPCFSTAVEEAANCLRRVVVEGTEGFVVPSF
jgi:hypothetical protein